MKCLTLTQPWASLVMLGEKRIETRRQLFKHRGLLWIHASRALDVAAWTDPTFREILDAHGVTNVDQVPLGRVLGSVEVIDGCRFTDQPFPDCLPADWPRIARAEGHFGNYAFGRAGLLLTDPKPLASPIVTRGMNGLWNWNPPAEALLETEKR
jgi:hypothetical protein